MSDRPPTWAEFAAANGIIPPPGEEGYGGGDPPDTPPGSDPAPPPQAIAAERPVVAQVPARAAPPPVFAPSAPPQALSTSMAPPPAAAPPEAPAPAPAAAPAPMQAPQLPVNMPAAPPPISLPATRDAWGRQVTPAQGAPAAAPTAASSNNTVTVRGRTYDLSEHPIKPGALGYGIPQRGPITPEQALRVEPTILKTESGDRNIPNAEGSGATGYYQITGETWRNFAPRVGVDVSKYPTAMSMPEKAVQRAVFLEILTGKGGGMQHYLPFNTPLRATFLGYRPPEPEVIEGKVQQVAATGNVDEVPKLIRETYPGMTLIDGWRKLETDLTARYVARGEIDKAHAISDYLSQTAHRGMNGHLQNAYQRMIAGDTQGTAEELAKSYAFFPDGAIGQFLATGDGRLFGRRIHEGTGQPIGKAFQITPEIILAQQKFTADPKTFMKTLTEMQKATAETYDLLNRNATRLTAEAMQQQNANYRTQYEQAHQDLRSNQQQAVETMKAGQQSADRAEDRALRRETAEGAQSERVASRLQKAEADAEKMAETKRTNERNHKIDVERLEDRRDARLAQTNDQNERRRITEEHYKAVEKQNEENEKRRAADAEKDRELKVILDEIRAERKMDEKRQGNEVTRKEAITSVNKQVDDIYPMSIEEKVAGKRSSEVLDKITKTKAAAMEMFINAGAKEDALHPSQAANYAYGLVEGRYKLKDTSTGMKGVFDPSRPNAPPLAVMDQKFVLKYLPELATVAPALSPPGAAR